MLRGTPTVNMSVNHTLSEPRGVDLKFMPLNHERNTSFVKIPPGVGELELPTYQDLISPEPSNIVQEINDLQKDIGEKDYLWVYVLVGALVITYLVLYFRFRYLKKKKKPQLSVQFCSANEIIEYNSQKLFNVVLRLSQIKTTVCELSITDCH